MQCNKKTFTAKTASIFSIQKKFLASDDEEGSLKDFIDDDDDDSDSDEDLDANSSNSSDSDAAASSNGSSVQSVRSDKPSHSKKTEEKSGSGGRRTRSSAKDCKCNMFRVVLVCKMFD